MSVDCFQYSIEKKQNIRRFKEIPTRKMAALYSF